MAPRACSGSAGENTMNGNDLARQIGQLRSDGKGLSKLTLLWRQKRTSSGTTGADCARNARDPERRLEPLRRRSVAGPR
jgi:hypothetical protein